MSSNDKNKVDAFLENQSLNFTCGTDFSEIVSSIDFDKAISRLLCYIQWESCFKLFTSS